PRPTDSPILSAGELVAAPLALLHALRRMDTLLESWFATARSCLPSPLKSPTATDTGPAPAGKLVAAPKEPLPVPSRMDTLAEARVRKSRVWRPCVFDSPTGMTLEVTAPRL